MPFPDLPCPPPRRDPRIPPDCVHVSLAVQDRARRFVRTGGILFPRFDEPWHAWPLADQVALERAARAALLQTLPPAAADLVARGRCRQFVLARMRRLHGPVPPAPGRVFAPPPATAVLVRDIIGSRGPHRPLCREAETWYDNDSHEKEICDGSDDT